MTPYTFHLTGEVKPEASGEFRRYKLESLEISTTLPGFLWVVLVRTEESTHENWCSMSSWESEAKLDLAGASPELTECVQRWQPYRYMVTTPARREVAHVVADVGSIEGRLSAEHVTYRLRDDVSDDELAAWTARPLEPATAKRVALRIVDEPTKVYEVRLSAGDPAPAAAPAGLLADEPVVRPAELVLALP